MPSQQPYSSYWNITPMIALVTRWLQSLQPRRPIGITYFSKALLGRLPHYQGIIQLEDGINLNVDTIEPSERELFFAGDRHRALTYILKQNTPLGGYCLDVGANIGFYALKFAKWAGSAGRVAAFEANPAMVQRLFANLEMNNFSNVEVISKAAHHELSTISFKITSDPVLSSINAQQNVIAELLVDTITIDDYIRQSGWERLDVIKLDIEGNDCNALLGATQALERFRPFITLEYQYNTPAQRAEPVFDLLKRLNYQLEIIVLRTGRRLPFDWRTPYAPNVRSTNVNCLPGR